MDLSELNNLDFENLGSWPAAAKAIFVTIAAAAVLGLGYWLDTKNQLSALESAEQQETQLKRDYERLEEKAANLDLLRQQMKEMKESFAVMLRQLPRKAEVEALLVDISQTGLAAGLEFNLFKPGQSSIKEFYDLPITMQVTGKFHEFGHFVSGAAALPRIVTLHDVDIKKKARGEDEHSQGAPQLTMDLIAKIYHYREEGDGAE
jgi:type IV pilus assembly protein PilO